MNCHEFQLGILDLARGREDAAARAHVAQCAACAVGLRREEALTAGLRALSAQAGVPDGAAMEADLLARFDAERAATARTVARSSRWFAVAAALVVIVGLGAAWRTLRSQPPANTFTVAAADASEFVPWPGAAALPAFESGQLVRMELPASVLPLLGISPAEGAAGGHVTADVLYGQDGLARAVRVVRQQAMQP